MINYKRICKVCGLYYPDFFPWGPNGRMPSHDICDCCGVEFGYEDNNLESVKKARKKWLAEGANWFNAEKKIKDWTLAGQLKNIPKEFLGADEHY